jgi:hypothetical protein
MQARQARIPDHFFTVPCRIFYVFFSYPLSTLGAFLMTF